jgi:hypothetical protein
MLSTDFEANVILMCRFGNVQMCKCCKYEHMQMCKCADAWPHFESD